MKLTKEEKENIKKLNDAAIKGFEAHEKIVKDLLGAHEKMNKQAQTEMFPFVKLAAENHLNVIRRQIKLLKERL